MLCCACLLPPQQTSQGQLHTLHDQSKGSQDFPDDAFSVPTACYDIEVSTEKADGGEVAQTKKHELVCVIDTSDRRAKKEAVCDLVVHTPKDIATQIVRPLVALLVPTAADGKQQSSSPPAHAQGAVVIDGSVAARNQILLDPYVGVVATAIREIAQLPSTKAVFLSAVELDEHNQLIDLLDASVKDMAAAHAAAQQQQQQPLRAPVLRHQIPTVVEDTNDHFTAVEETTFENVTADCHATLRLLAHFTSEARHHVLSLVLLHRDGSSNTTLQFVSFAAAEVTRGTRASRNSICNAASLLESKSSAVSYTATKILFLLKPLLTGKQPSAWVTVLQPRSQRQLSDGAAEETFKDAFLRVQTLHRLSGVHRSGGVRCILLPTVAAVVAKSHSSELNREGLAERPRVADAHPTITAPSTAASSSMPHTRSAHSLRNIGDDIDRKMQLLAATPLLDQRNAIDAENASSALLPFYSRDRPQDQATRQRSVSGSSRQVVTDPPGVRASSLSSNEPEPRTYVPPVSFQAAPVSGAGRRPATPPGGLRSRAGTPGKPVPSSTRPTGGWRSQESIIADDPELSQLQRKIDAAERKKMAQEMRRRLQQLQQESILSNDDVAQSSSVLLDASRYTDTASAKIRNSQTPPPMKKPAKKKSIPSDERTEVGPVATPYATRRDSVVLPVSQHSTDKQKADALLHNYETYKHAMEGALVRLRSDVVALTAQCDDLKKQLRQKDKSLRTGSEGVSAASRELEVATKRIHSLEDELQQVQGEHHAQKASWKSQRTELCKSNEAQQRHINDLLETVSGLEGALSKAREAAYSKTHGLTASAMTCTTVCGLVHTTHDVAMMKLSASGSASSFVPLDGSTGGKPNAGAHNNTYHSTSFITKSLPMTNVVGIPRGTQTSFPTTIELQQEMEELQLRLRDYEGTLSTLRHENDVICSREHSLQQRILELEQEVVLLEEREVAVKMNLLKSEQALRFERQDQERRTREKEVNSFSVGCQATASLELQEVLLHDLETSNRQLAEQSRSLSMELAFLRTSLSTEQQHSAAVQEDLSRHIQHLEGEVTELKNLRDRESHELQEVIEKHVAEKENMREQLCSLQAELERLKDMDDVPRSGNISPQSMTSSAYDMFPAEIPHGVALVPPIYHQQYVQGTLVKTSPGRRQSPIQQRVPSNAGAQQQRLSPVSTAPRRAATPPNHPTNSAHASQASPTPRRSAEVASPSPIVTTVGRQKLSNTVHHAVPVQAFRNVVTNERAASTSTLVASPSPVRGPSTTNAAASRPSAPRHAVSAASSPPASTTHAGNEQSPNTMFGQYMARGTTSASQARHSQAPMSPPRPGIVLPSARGRGGILGGGRR